MPSRTSLALLLAVLIPAAHVRAQNVTGEQVRQAVESAKRFLIAEQQANGKWEDFMLDGGTTALATLALLNAGMSPTERPIARALEHVRRQRLSATYVVSLKIQALAAADPKRYLPEIRAAAEWLVKAQNRTGMWGYDSSHGSSDFSNTQFALLGLHEAGRAGVKIPEKIWRAAERAYTVCQQRDGGWGYTPDPAGSTGSMTAAGIASLYIVGSALEMRTESGFTEEGFAPRCGRYAEFRPIARGLEWLARNFSPSRNPSGSGWTYYYLYGVERVGILSGLRFYGNHDWYREGAEVLVRIQRRDGSWRETHSIVDTSFGLLFLAKGHKSILFQKLQWSADNAWNMDRNDLANLTAFIGDRLGDPVTWQVTSSRSSLEEWLAAPILYLNGHITPRLDARAKAQLREYITQGGTVLAEACCGRKEFADGFRAITQELFPDFELRQLPPDHPVFRSMFPLNGERIQLEGMDVGCRTSVFLSPVDLSCLWEQANIPRKSEAAFQLGTNIAAYATGLEPLADRLDAVRIVRRPDDQATSRPAARGAVHIAQLMHNGDWRPDPSAMPHLAEHLHAGFGVDVVPHSEPLAATDARLAQHPMVYMTGHFTFRLAPDELEALRRHLERGGFLFADACCGRAAFDKAFREMAAQLFPNAPLQPLPPGHAILAGMPGVPLGTVGYKPTLMTEKPDLKGPVLEGITLEGRTVLVYSPYSVGCGLDGHTCFACRGLLPPDARNVAGNIILYALSY